MVAAAPTAPTLPPDGHFLAKSEGNTLYEGPLEPAPLPPHATAAEAAESLHRDGYVILPGVLGRDEVAGLRARMDAEGGDDARYQVPKWCFNKHLAAAFHRHPETLALVDRPAVAGAARAVLGGDCQVTGGSLWITGPGRAMGLHVDWQPVSLPEDVLADPRVLLPVFAATAHYYLDDLTLDLGPTILVPGSQRAGRPPRDETTWRGRAPRAALLRAGDCLLFRSDLWHGAAMNRGPARRYLVQVHYGNVYVKGGAVPVTQPDAWNPACLAALTPTARELLGQPPALGRGSYVDHASLIWRPPAA